MPSLFRSATFRLISILLWILLVLGGYYWVHKPISPDLLSAPLKALSDLLLAFLILALCGGLGRRILPAPNFAPLERLAVNAALGGGLLGLFWFFMGFVSLFHSWAAWLMLVIGLLVLFKHAIAWVKDLDDLKTTWANSGTLEKWLMAAVLWLVFAQLLFALAPPARWDALTYHLALPRQFLENGNILTAIENPYWGHPKLTEMLYTWAMALLGRPQTAAVVGWGFGIIFLAGIAGVCTRLCGEVKKGSPADSKAGLVAVTALVAGYTVRHMLSFSYTDLFSALMGLGALICTFEWLATQQAPWLRWTGVFIGLAIGTKWTSGVIAIGIFGACLLVRKRAGTPWSLILQSSGLALLVCLPWGLSNLAVTGNPLYPYFFPTNWVSALRLAMANPPPGVINWAVHIPVPFSATWLGVDSASGFGTDLGPLLLLLAVPGLWAQRRRVETPFLLTSLLTGWLSISLLGARNAHLAQPRLYFSILPALAVAAGWGWQALQQEILAGVRLRRLMGAVLLLVMALAVWQDLAERASLAPGSVILGRKSEDQYLDDSLGWYAPTMRALHQLPPGSRILMLWEPRGLYAPPFTQSDPWIDNWRMALWQEKSPQAILDLWKRQGYSHMLLYNSGAEFVRKSSTQLSASDWQVFDDLLARLPQPLSFGNIYSLYRLNP